MTLNLPAGSTYKRYGKRKLSHSVENPDKYTQQEIYPLSPLKPTHWDKGTLSVLAATLNFEHTLVIIHHIARLADTALLAGGGDLGAGTLTASFRVQTGRQAGRKAGGVLAVCWALQS